MHFSKIKKIIFNLFVAAQIFVLVFGSVTPVYAIGLLDALNPSGVVVDWDSGDGEEDADEESEVESLKRNNQVPAVSIMLSPTKPKVGEKVTATAVASKFSSDEKSLYFTWFLKRKACETEVDTGGRKYKTDSKGYSPETDYPSHDKLSDVPDEGEETSQKDCDTDEDGLITVNDWKITAMRNVVQNGFEPDLEGKYSTLDGFYAQDGDSDGYQTWQGGAEGERMPSYCYSYHQTEGYAYALFKKNSASVPMCPNSILDRIQPNVTHQKIPAVCGKDVEVDPVGGDTEDPCYCGADVDSDGNRDVPACYECTDGIVNSRWTLGNLFPTPPAGPVDGVDYTDGIVQWWECLIDGGTGYYCHVTDSSNFGNPGHMDCEQSATFDVCEKQANSPYCGKISSGDKKGQYAALCGEDADENGLDDDDSQGVAICPTRGDYQIGGDFFDISSADFSSAITSGLTFQEDEYIYGRKGGYSPFSELPACNCAKTGTMETPELEEGEPYTGSEDEPLCENGAPTADDLLCGEGEVASSEYRFHIFPQRLKDGKNYYETTREYADGSENEYELLTENNVGADADFTINDEKFWGTDPRNSSTAGNGQVDEANLAGLGMKEFSWTYQEGDEVGVGVEGISNFATKFANSSRMIMWAFSKGTGITTLDGDKPSEAACQADPMAYFDLELTPSSVTIIRVNVAFLDFDHCIENSTIPVISEETAEGAQPSNMEVELSVSPDKPLNDENGTGGGDVVDVQAIVSENNGPESDINYSWEIKAFQPETKNGASVIPNSNDWEGVGEDYVCKAGDASCPFTDEQGKALKLEGTGISGISFGLDIAQGSDLHTALFNEIGEGYLKVIVKAREDDDSTNPPGSRLGTGEAVFKVSTSENRIVVFRPTISGEKLSSTGTTFCAEDSICSVLRSEIVGLSISNEAKGEALTDISWSVDGKGIDSCNEKISSACVSGNTVFNYVPITGDVGDTFTVNVKASNVSGADGATGKSLDLSKDFKIVEPSINIVSADEDNVWPKLIGKKVDPTLEDDDSLKYEDDWSKSVLETFSGSSAEFELDYTPTFLADLDLDENWQIDGASKTTPKFTAGEVGTIHNISASVVYAPSTAMNLALYKLFGVPKSDLVSQTMTDSIQVEVNEEAEEVAFKNPSRFLANLLSKIPAQVLFFLRLILSAALTIGLVGIIFAFFPETAYDRRRMEQ